MELKTLTLKEKIKDLREEKGLTQIELAKQTGLDKNTIYNLENDKTRGNSQTIEILAEYFKVTKEYLLNDKCMNKDPSNLDLGRELGLSDKSIDNIKYYYKIPEGEEEDNSIPKSFFEDLNDEKKQILDTFLSEIELNSFLTFSYECKLINKLNKLNDDLRLYSLAYGTDNADNDYKKYLIEELYDFKEKNQNFMILFRTDYQRIFESFTNNALKFLEEENIENINTLYYGTSNNLYKMNAETKYQLIKVIENYLNK